LVERSETPQRGGLGLTTGLKVSDCWARVFRDNEARAADYAGPRGPGRVPAERPWTDEQISNFMKQEFPDASDDSRSQARVRMYRGCYNRGTHSFSHLGVPERESREYDADGEPVASSRRTPGGGASEDRVREIAVEVADQRVAAGLAQLAKQDRPVVHVSVNGAKARRVDARGKHCRFVDVLKRVEAGVPVLLVGPTGSGKSFLCQQVAEALGFNFTFNSMSDGVTDAELFGRSLPDKNGVWSYQPSPFVTTWRDGGLHLMDELDASDPNTLVKMHAPLANGLLSLPLAGSKPIRRHKDCVVVAAANTYGSGADRMYVGRNQLDEATRNRFVMGTIEIGYDADLERVIAHSLLEERPELAGELLKWAWATRGKIEQLKLRRVMSTRNIEDAAKVMAVGVPLADVRATYFLGWTEDETRKVSGVAP
jgi:MoxR-like ATPase